MTDDPVAGWKARFDGLLDPHATGSDQVLDVKADDNRAGLRRRLRREFAQQTHVKRILVRIEGHEIGIATRATADRRAGTAGDQAPGVDPGSSDGATLPGLPGEYRPIRFTCPDTNCTETLSASVLASFYDEREVPSCPKHGKAVWSL